MKKILLVTILIFALAFTFVACDPVSNEPPATSHDHSYSEKWTYDENNHWRAATCEHTDQVDGKAPHDMLAMPADKTLAQCKTCGYQAATSHTHTVATEYSTNEQGHWHVTTCGCSYEDFAPHNFVDGICVACGWWSSASDVLFAELSKMEAWNYTVLLDNVLLNNVNLLSEGIEQGSLTVNGELKLNVTPDGQIEGEGYFEADGMTIKAVISNGVVYACGNGSYIRCALGELLAKTDVDLKQIQKYIDEINADTQTAREYVEKIRQYLNMLTADDNTAMQLLTKLVKEDNANSTSKLTAYVVDAEVLYQLNERLANTTVEQYANAILANLSNTALGSLLGDNLASLPDNIYTLLKTPIGKTLLKLRLDSYSLDDLLGEINAIIAKYYPDDKVNTIDELLPVFGVNLNGVSVKEAIVSASILSPETLWNGMQNDESNKISADDISAKLEEIIEAYGDKTLYEIMLADNSQLTNNDVKALVDDCIEMLNERITVRFYIDGDGVLQQVELVAIESNVEDGQAANQLQQLLEIFNGTVLLQRGYVTEQDYSKVIEQVNAYYNSLEQSAINA